jgi:hypothetical protein
MVSVIERSLPAIGWKRIQTSVSPAITRNFPVKWITPPAPAFLPSALRAAPTYRFLSLPLSLFLSLSLFICLYVTVSVAVSVSVTVTVTETGHVSCQCLFYGNFVCGLPALS